MQQTHHCKWIFLARVRQCPACVQRRDVVESAPEMLGLDRPDSGGKHHFVWEPNMGYLIRHAKTVNAGCCFSYGFTGVYSLWCDGGAGGVVGLILGFFECCCVSASVGIRLVLIGLRGLCTVEFFSTSNVVVVVRVSVFRVFGLFCGLVGGGV